MKKARMIVNIAMTVVLLCLMAYTLVGETAHEVLGTVNGGYERNLVTAILFCCLHYRP